MRPNFVVFALDQNGSLVAWELFYSEQKSKHTFEIFQKRNASGYHVLSSETGDSERHIPGELSVKRIYLGEYIPTSTDPRRKSFFGVQANELIEISLESGIPVTILEEIAACERDFIEGRGSARSDARKRTFLPKFFHKFL